MDPSHDAVRPLLPATTPEQAAAILGAMRAVAETGVDYLAAGALTHSSPALDLALDLRPSRPNGPGRPSRSRPASNPS